jgi:hypothetical protein
MSGSAVRIVLAALMLLLGWWLAGPAGLLMAGVLAAVLLARVVIDGLSGGVSLVRTLAYKDVEGDYYAYRGTPIGVVEDIDGHRWLRVTDVRRVLTGLPREGTLKNLDPERVSELGQSGTWYMRADALIDWLSRAQEDEGIRFKRWVQKEVYFPSAARRTTPPSTGFPSEEDSPR